MFLKTGLYFKTKFDSCVLEPEPGNGKIKYFHIIGFEFISLYKNLFRIKSYPQKALNRTLTKRLKYSPNDYKK